MACRKMVEPQNIFQGMTINKFFKYVLYLAGIILILSLFIEVKGIDANFIRKASFVFVIIGLVLWIINDLLDNVSSYYGHLEEIERIREDKAREIIIGLMVFWYIFIAVSLVIGFWIAFG